MAPTQGPTPEDIDRVAGIVDPVIRNLRITQAYHELSAAAAAHLGQVANWCTYATWASKQAGRTIRKEDLRLGLEADLRSSPAAMSAAAQVTTEARRSGARIPAGAAPMSLWDLVDPMAALDRASAAVARGNLRVFAEVGLEFARFDVACAEDVAVDSAALARFLTGLVPGEPPDGQRYLGQAFTRYQQARFEADPVGRAQLILLADLEIGFHEQTRLQPDIAEALDAAVVDPRELRDRVISALFADSAWLVRVRAGIGSLLGRLFGRRTPLDRAIDTFVAEAQRLVRSVVTRHLMSIQLGTAVRLQLGEDIDAEYPPALQVIDLPELRELLERIDPAGHGRLGSGAADWADQADRMRFIAEMFRCYAESTFLFDPPFTPEQLARLEAGERPPGPL